MRRAHVGQVVVGDRGRHRQAAVSDGRPVDDDLQHQEPVAAARDAAGRAALAVGLKQPILNVDGLARVFREVDYDISALRYAQSHGRDLNRMRQEVAIVGDLPERLRP